MLGSMKRRKVLRDRQQAAEDRLQAAADLALAIRDAESAMEALGRANDKFYHSDQAGEQVTLCSLRAGRERTFSFHVANEMMSEAPRLARLLGVRASSSFALPLVEWIAAVTDADVGAVAGQNESKGDPA